MNFTEISVRRPAAVIMVVILFISLGIIGYTNLGANLLPDVDMPIISVMTTYTGAGVEEIEEDIIKPIEDAVSSITGIDTMRSVAGVGYGYTTLMFKMDVDADTAFMDVQQALGDVSSKLPKDAAKPVLRKYNKNNQPVMMLSVSGKVPYEELFKHADEITETLEKLKGVASVSLEGSLDKQLAVKIDKAAIEYYGISLNTVINKLSAENVGLPAGQIKQEGSEQTLQVQGEFENIIEIKGLRIPASGGGAVRLDEIARISLEYTDPEEYIRLNGENSIGISIHKQGDANIIQVTDLVKKELKAMEKDLPEAVNLVIADDQSGFINATVNGVKNNLIEGIITTSIVMFLFMRRWRSSIIVLVAIPVSLISTFFMMYVFKFTMNIMSLMGLSVCIGILVDDSIVVLENIQRHLRMGKDSVTAAIEGRKEIGMAAIAITLCDVVVFGPVAFMSGMIGQFFREFGLTVVFATLFSLLVSFTVTPMLSSKLLRKEDDLENQVEKAHKKKDSFSKFLQVINKKYRKLLEWSLDNRWKVVGIVTLSLALSTTLIPLKFITTEFIPKTDQSSFIVDIALKPGSDLSRTDEKVKIVEEHIKSLKEMKNYLTTVGSESNKASARIIVNLLKMEDRKKSQSQIVEEIRKWSRGLTGVDITVSESSIVGATSIDGGSKPVAINLLGSDRNVLKKLSGEVEQLVGQVPGITDVGNSAKTGKSDISVRIDRLAAAEYGVMASDIASTLRTAVNGMNAGIFSINGSDYDIVVKFDANQIKTAYDVGNIRIMGLTGQQAMLHQVAQISTVDSPQEIMRQGKQVMSTISANIEGRALGEVTKDIESRLKEVQLPKGYSIKFGGDQQNMIEAFDSLIKVLIASIVLVYMILVVLYESYLTPVIRMLALPCGAIGAFAALALTGSSLNIVSMIGLIMLDGLASKNGTLLIDYTNTLIKRGVPLREALLEAGTTRLRPIIMTSVTMIVGMVPAAIALGEGSEIKASMAIAIIGGMITSTILSPILIPAAYTIIEDIRKFFSSRRRKNTGIYVETNGGAVR